MNFSKKNQEHSFKNKHIASKNLQRFIAVFAVLFTVALSAQNTNGKAYYVVKNKVDIDLSQRQISEQQKAFIKKRISDMSKSNYVLTFNKTQSTYKEQEQLEQEQTGNAMLQQRMGMMKMMLNQGDNGELYKNVSDKNYISQNDIYGKQFLVEDSLQSLDWTVTDEVKTIGNYTCFKATAEIETFEMPKMRPPNQGKENERKNIEPKKVKSTVIAWFTLDIPVSNGPSKYQGLPGLILEVHTNNAIILCSKIELFKKEVKINPPTSGKKVSQEKYDKILAKKTKEVRENFRNQRRQGGGNRRF